MLGAAYSYGVGTGNAVWLLAPGMAIILVVMAFTLVGHALETVARPPAAGALMSLLELRDLTITYQHRSRAGTRRPRG